MPRWLLCVVSFWLWSFDVCARVVVVRWTSGPDARTAEVATRLRGELLTMGLEVVVREISEAERLPAAALFTPEVDAVMEVAASSEQLLAEIWLRDDAGSPARWTMLAEPNGAKNAQERLALRASEALHSLFVERALTPRNSEEEPNEGAVRPLGVPRPNTQDVKPREPADSPADSSAASSALRRPGLALGGVLITATGLSPSLTPLLRFEWPVLPWLTPHVTAAGLGTQSDVSTANGRASVSWNYAVIGASYHPVDLGFLQPFLAVATGAGSSAVRGNAEAPLSGHDSQHLVWLVEASLGALVPLSPSYYATITGHAHLTQPNIAVHVVDDVAAVSGRPNWLLSLAAGVRL